MPLNKFSFISKVQENRTHSTTMNHAENSTGNMFLLNVKKFFLLTSRSNQRWNHIRFYFRFQWLPSNNINRLFCVITNCIELGGTTRQRALAIYAIVTLYIFFKSIPTSSHYNVQNSTKTVYLQCKYHGRDTASNGVKRKRDELLLSVGRSVLEMVEPATRLVTKILDC